VRSTGLVVACGLAAVLALALVVTGWRQPRPTVGQAMRRLHRTPVALASPDAHDRGVAARLGALPGVGRLLERCLPSTTALRLIGRAPDTHVGYLVAAALAGLVVPSSIIAVLSLGGGVAFGVVVPAALSIAAVFLAPTIVHLAAISAADDVRIDLRHQLSAYLDMVTMLLAGNTGHEGALDQAASAGDGLLFRELRRRMREVATTGDSLVRALSLVAADYELAELEQVASATALSAAEGAPVARTLAAKCSTLRSTLAADQEARARVRNDKVTPPLVGMALLFMALIIYPALDLG
jgi:Flp pilus assembly protein TadB